MCQDCGCSITPTPHQDDAHHHHDNPHLNAPKTLEVLTHILDKNNRQAAHNREHFEHHNVLAINLMSSPGSGKTALLESFADTRAFKFAVIEGDLQTNRDTLRLQAKGIDAYQIQTGSACHLDAFMVHKALHHLPLENTDLCFVENVGNLVCPAAYDVGTHLNIVLVSVPEGSDKIEKYPVMFRKADLILISKTDLLPYFDYDIAHEKAVARKLNPSVDILEVSIKEPQSIERVIEWITFKRNMRG